MPKQNKPSPVQLAARIYGCPVEELLSYREYDDGAVVIIAPTGQKFTYSAHSIMEYALKSAEGSPAATPGSMFKLHKSAALHSCEATDLESFEEQLLSGSPISEVPQVTHTDPVVLAALEETQAEVLAEAEKIGAKSEQTAGQLSCSHLAGDSVSRAAKKKRRATEHSKAQDVK
jgi:hypothetical protein